MVTRFQKYLKRFGSPVLAGLLIVTILLLTVAAPCASLHKRVHHDHCGASDTCALCLVLQGHLASVSTAPIQDSFVAVVSERTPTIISSTVLQLDLRLSASRAPPIA